MANDERCYYCGANETLHDLELVTCPEFASEVQHHSNCPVEGCPGSLFCEVSITQQEVKAVHTMGTNPILFFNY